METADSLANEVDQNSVRSTGQELQDGPIYSYELVQEVEIDYTRPVVILGKDTNMYNLVYLNCTLNFKPKVVQHIYILCLKQAR